jgi:C_GCAxxG_C_C family probable redox protein
MEFEAPNEAATLLARTRDLFLRDDNTYGCAETALVALQEHFGLPDPTESGAAMALNGGVAYSGGPCGAITGVALAVGRLARQRIEDHREAKRVARTLVQEVMAEFTTEFGSTSCRELTGFDLRSNHEAFIESGVWRTDCMRQVEFAVVRLAPLAEPEVWETEMERLGPAG